MSQQPLQVHPENPHYFLFRGRPTILITSGEHYGAVVNRAFHFRKYLDTLQDATLNLTRLFVGPYIENTNNHFGVTCNTLAPDRGEFICPWKRSDTPGYRNGGNRFDLSAWDDTYFRRLADFLEAAAERGIVVEVNLFCPFYIEDYWQLSPWHPENNINGIGNIASDKVYTLDTSPELLAIQESMVQQIVTHLNRFDNLYYEVCNEPYFGGVTGDWQAHIVDIISSTESALPNRHLISLNIANGAEQVQAPHPAVSILNFHYAFPPDTVAMNYSLERIIGDNETGFQGTGDTHYRMEGWQFILAGGGLYNNLDFSFTVGCEDGTFQSPPNQPGGGGRMLRTQLRIPKDFIQSFDFLRMHPDASILHGELPEGQRAYALVEPDRQYAIYVFGGKQANLQLVLPAGAYQVQWVDTLTGSVSAREEILHQGSGTVALLSPEYAEDIALRMIKRT